MEAPLRGKKVLVTRAEAQAGAFAGKLKEAGAVPFTVPLLTFRRRKNEENDRIFNQLHEFSWVFFTSANGVKFFFHYFKEMEKDVNEARGIRFGVVGTKTEKALHSFGFTAAFKPASFSGREMAEAFTEECYRENEKVLIVNGNLAREDIATALTKQQVLFQKIVLYDTLLNVESKMELMKLLETEPLDIYTFTSPSTIQAFIELTTGNADLVNQIKKEKLCVCIGPTTKAAAEEQGFANVRMPGMFTIEGMTQEMSNHYMNERTGGSNERSGI